MNMTKNKSSTLNTESKTSRMTSNNRKGPFVDTAILSMSDLERIKKNATILTKEDEMNNKKILEDQKLFAQASAQVNYYFKKNQRKENNILTFYNLYQIFYIFPFSFVI